MLIAALVVYPWTWIWFHPGDLEEFWYFHRRISIRNSDFHPSRRTHRHGPAAKIIATMINDSAADFRMPYTVHRRFVSAHWINTWNAVIVFTTSSRLQNAKTPKDNVSDDQWLATTLYDYDHTYHTHRNDRIFRFPSRFILLDAVYPRLPLHSIQYSHWCLIAQNHKSNFGLELW